MGTGEKNNYDTGVNFHADTKKRMMEFITKRNRESVKALFIQIRLHYSAIRQFPHVPGTAIITNW
jgi:hypothetical protein